MKIAELIQRIQSLYSKGVQSDSSRLTSRHIYNKLLTLRNRLLSEKAKKKQKISAWNYQTIPCIEIISVPNHQCPCLPSIGCDVKRTKYKIPKILSNYNSNLINFIMTVDNQETFSIVSRTELIYNKGNRFTKENKKAILEDGYIYLYGKNLPDVIAINALFEDPVEAENFPSFCNKIEEVKECFDIFETEFPIDSDMIDVLIEMSVQELIGVFNQGVEDISSDNMDNQQRQQQ